MIALNNFIHSFLIIIEKNKKGILRFHLFSLYSMFHVVCELNAVLKNIAVLQFLCLIIHLHL